MQPEATGVQSQPTGVDLVLWGHAHKGLGGSRPPEDPILLFWRWANNNKGLLRH